jgi:hypothetical protein
VAQVPLDGLRIEVPHSSPSGEVATRLAEFAQDMADNHFSDWGVRVTQVDGRNFVLAGGRNGTHFDAKVEANDARAVIDLTGSISLSRIKLTLAGGADGVRKRVASELEATLRRHLT